MGSFLLKWQTLIGVAISGVFSIVVAYIVGIRPRRYEEKSAAMLLIENMKALKSAFETVRTMVDKPSRQDAHKPIAMAGMFALQGYPKVSHLFSELMLKVVWIDLELGAHLSLAKVFLEQFEVAVEKFDKASKILQQNPADPIAKEEYSHYSKLIWSFTDKATKHIDCAISLLNQFYVDTCFGINRIYRNRCKTVECRNLLQNG